MIAIPKCIKCHQPYKYEINPQSKYWEWSPTCDCTIKWEDIERWDDNVQYVHNGNKALC